MQWKLYQEWGFAANMGRWSNLIGEDHRALTGKKLTKKIRLVYKIVAERWVHRRNPG